ncbi:hypothetical protein [Streptomyces sp. NPDC010273]
MAGEIDHERRGPLREALDLLDGAAPRVVDTLIDCYPTLPQALGR